jgi:hypothetical protein
MLTSQSLADFAIIEYNRDTAFRRLVDREVAGLLESGAVPAGTPLREIFEQEIEGLPRAKLWLDAHHDATGQPQWQRVREGLKAAG